VLTDPLRPPTAFQIHHISGGRGGVIKKPRRRQENPGLIDDEFREAMDQLRPAKPYKKRGDHRAMIQNRVGAEAPPPAPEEKTCTICLDTFVPGEPVMVTHPATTCSTRGASPPG
jgi:hypothetical protein